MMAFRVASSRFRLMELLNIMSRNPDLSTPEKLLQLKTELAETFKNPAFLKCRSMGQVVKRQLKQTLQKESLPPAKKPEQIRRLSFRTLSSRHEKIQSPESCSVKNWKPFIKTLKTINSHCPPSTPSAPIPSMPCSKQQQRSTLPSSSSSPMAVPSSSPAKACPTISCRVISPAAFPAPCISIT
jgi:hypothetical protein